MIYVSWSTVVRDLSSDATLYRDADLAQLSADARQKFKLLDWSLVHCDSLVSSAATQRQSSVASSAIHDPLAEYGVSDCEIYWSSLVANQAG